MAYQLKKKLFTIVDPTEFLGKQVIYAALANNASDFYNGIAERYNKNDKTLDDYIRYVIYMFNYGANEEEYVPVTGTLLMVEFNNYKNGGQFVVQELNVDTY